MTHGQEKSDLFIVALKPANKPGRLGAELVEPRERTEGNTGEQHTCRTLRRVNVSQRLDCVREAASWDSSLTTRGGSPVRESRPPGSVRGASSNGCPYRNTETIDTSGPCGRLMMNMLGAFNQFEREIIKERTKLGLKRARANGRIGGGRVLLSNTQQAAAIRMVDSGEKTQTEVAELFDVSKATLSRLITRAHSKRKGVL